MKKSLIIALTIITALSSCSRPRILSEQKMTDIFIDMYLTDRYIDSHPEFREIADTTFVYGPILEYYGYTQEDFLNSINYYLTKFNKYEKILKNVKEYFEKMQEEATQELDLSMKELEEDNPVDENWDEADDQGKKETKKRSRSKKNKEEKN